MSLEFDLTLARREFDLHLSGEFGKGITGIFGPSGSGKTSFFNLLAGIEKPESGFIRLNDRVLADVGRKVSVPIHKRRVGYVFQDRLLFPHLTVRDNLLFGIPYTAKTGLSFDEIVDFLDLKPLLKSKPARISGGEQQRVAIGRALLCTPDLLLLDEPFNAIDYSLRSSILATIRELGEKTDIPVLVISHDREDLVTLSDRLYRLSGRGLNGCRKFNLQNAVKIG
ncbi:ATP-binding cassette domain-containing protein [Spirochaeta isovalerica]|uniref:ABC-type molybdate transport system ATPase subunit n=1 Tax=Spirochaeta isovalerica TaxID=150 RepID=A0A841RAV2_9SPIO|nr:ATP-binding cassette domain-containing protein [Spirochaeta isovalerica]MBB6480140.1 ABC-type molybdate transport system ATPase subunit [Spirochaeta isovalerica]